MSGARLDPGDLNGLIKGLIEKAAESKAITLIENSVLLPEKEYKKALHCFIFKRAAQTADAETKLTEAASEKFIFAYTVKDSSTPENTRSLYSLEETLPSLKELAEKHQSVLYMPLALCRNIAKINVNITQLHHMVLLELNAPKKSLQIYDSEGFLLASFQETLRAISTRLALIFYPDKVSDLKEQYKYLGWKMLGIQKQSQQCVRYVAAELESILQSGDASRLSQVKLTVEDYKTERGSETVVLVDQLDEDPEVIEAEQEQNRQSYGRISPRKFTVASGAPPSSSVTPVTDQYMRKKIC